ncbi:T9SS type A sorting domain-containing protein [Bacteroidota bacterium]
MKIYVIALITLFLAKGIYAQNILVENFDSDQIPQSWTINQYTENWEVKPSIRAGGNPNELRLSSEPYFDDTARIISPAFDLSAYPNVYLKFRYLLDQNDTAVCSFGVATRINFGAWETIWQASNPIGPVGPSEEYVYIDSGSGSPTDFQFCFYYIGESTEINNWFIDNVVLFNQYEDDLELASINMPGYGIEKEYSVYGRITNVGYNQITSAGLNYAIDDGIIISKTLNNLDLEFSESFNFSFDDQVFLGSGEHFLKMWISDVNYLNNDDNQNNDSLDKTINIAGASVQRLMLFEEFASSTCISCANFNNNLLHPLLQANSSKYALIKYPMNFPLPGDPYYFQDIEVRKDSYGRATIPYLTTDGGMGVMSQNQFDIRYNKPALVDIESVAHISGNQIAVTAEIEPFINIQDAVVYIAVTEKTTYGNVQNNGETEFYNILMAMLPSMDGISITANAGEIIQISETKDLSGTHIEEIDDLEVVVYLQDNITKEVFQSSISDITVSTEEMNSLSENIRIYPNPFYNFLNIEIDVEKEEDYSIIIRDINGQVLKQINKHFTQGFNPLRWNANDLNNMKVGPGIYIIEFISKQSRICRKVVKSN